ncbi:Rossmann-like and DUF2520 domain-containing protein [Flavobacterium caeni]|uniref:Predicted oxidoreductase, contains short-chain dehydrogenase (SDR) and DUF2520 domains n=1 Tax=Flavobacterium caeni TaxID=490189 RepID=A0A1G5BNH7_9FLAO|nr:Rossmann-like and DUF2520 domain-containing protein [Flavobacterium caeni]SCX91617.1 Predicted oxidoreductase, contains short-chain dehydrogenase (SDR) and DUF2520 domains [Flavobacterium caeni]
MVTITVIGSGNVAHHLIQAFSQSTAVELVQLFARDSRALEQFSGLAEITDDLSGLKPADLYVIAVSDDAIGMLSERLPFENRLVVHTSGSVSIEGLDHKNRRGVFYPLQTFSKNKTVDFDKIPICLEAQTPDDYKMLETVAGALSKKVYPIDSTQRQALHVAAVFVNNFVNHLYAMGADICDANQIPFEILKPLILETADKVMTLTPNEAQTGPAKRNDAATIQKHLDFLPDNQQKIYELLTHSIQHGQKL